MIKLSKTIQRILFLLTCSFTFLIPTVSYSDYWSDEIYTHFSKNEPLIDMLEAMALDQDLPIVVSSNVTDNISAYFKEQKASDIFSTLKRTYGLVAYFDGDALYIYKNDEVISKTLTLNKSPVKFLEKALFDIGAMDPNIKDEVKWRINSKLNSVTFRGVQRFIDIANGVADKLNSNNYIYKWMDKKKRVHYSNDPPFESSNYLKIMSISATAANSTSSFSTTAVERIVPDKDETETSTTDVNETESNITNKKSGSDDTDDASPPSPSSTSVTIVH